MVLEEEWRRCARKKSENDRESRERSPGLEAPLFIRKGMRSWGGFAAPTFP